MWHTPSIMTPAPNTSLKPQQPAPMVQICLDVPGLHKPQPSSASTANYNKVAYLCSRIQELCHTRPDAYPRIVSVLEGAVKSLEDQGKSLDPSIDNDPWQMFMHSRDVLPQVPLAASSEPAPPPEAPMTLGTVGSRKFNKEKNDGTGALSTSPSAKTTLNNQPVRVHHEDVLGESWLDDAPKRGK